MEKIMPLTKSVRIERLGRTVECYDLSMAYVDRVSQDQDYDTAAHAIEDATDLEADEIAGLRLHEANALYRTILELTRNGREPSDEEAEPGK